MTLGWVSIGIQWWVDSAECGVLGLTCLRLEDGAAGAHSMETEDFHFDDCD